MNKGLAAALIAAAGLSACATRDDVKASKERNPAPCPNILVLNEAGRQIVFDGDAALENVAWTAEITDVSLSCRYFAAKPIEASADITIAFGRGPKAVGRKHDFTYFVAVTRTDSEVIEKKEFTIPVEFDSDEASKRVAQEIEEIIIPRKGENTSGANFEVVIGMAVTPDQAIFNRSGKSLKFPDLK